MPFPPSSVVNKEDSPYRKGPFRVEITRIIGCWPKKIFIQWILRNPSSGSGYTFKIYRSESENGPWEQIANDIVDTYFFVDDAFPAPNDRTKPDLMSMRRFMCYKVAAHHTTDGNSENIQRIEGSLDKRRQGILRKLRRDAYVMLKKGSGTEVAILKRKWWGDSCTCRTLIGQVTRAHCNACNGTGIITGYWAPVYSYASHATTPTTAQTAPQGNVESNVIRVSIPDIPEVSRYDILVYLRNNRRFMIENVMATEIHSVAVHQEIEISELSKTSREYDLLVDPWKQPPWF